MFSYSEMLKAYYHSSNLKEVLKNGFPLPPAYQVGKGSFLEELRSTMDILGEFSFVHGSQLNEYPDY